MDDQPKCALVALVFLLFLSCRIWFVQRNKCNGGLKKHCPSLLCSVQHMQLGFSIPVCCLEHRDISGQLPFLNNLETPAGLNCRSHLILHQCVSTHKPDGPGHSRAQWKMTDQLHDTTVFFQFHWSWFTLMNRRNILEEAVVHFLICVDSCWGAEAWGLSFTQRPS